MVHALQHAHRLLRPNGCLITVHDIPIPHQIEVHSGDTAIKAGWLLDSDDYDNERAANDAITEIVTQRYFHLEDEREFSFDIHIDELIEMQEWLSERWQSALLPEETINRILELMRHTDDPKKIVLKCPARMTKLRMRD
jgi:hypothetical protein